MYLKYCGVFKIFAIFVFITLSLEGRLASDVSLAFLVTKLERW